MQALLLQSIPSHEAINNTTHLGAAFTVQLFPTAASLSHFLAMAMWRSLLSPSSPQPLDGVLPMDGHNCTPMGCQTPDTGNLLACMHGSWGRGQYGDAYNGTSTPRSLQQR